MTNCLKCNKELGFFERQSVTNIYIDKVFPEYKNKNFCKDCMKELHQAAFKTLNEQAAFEKLNEGSDKVLYQEVSDAILWQKDEISLSEIECKEFFEDRTRSIGARIGHTGFLVVTNQRVLFGCKLGRLSKEYAVMYGTNLENIVTVSHGKFGYNDKLIILENNNQHRDFVHPKIHSVIPTINSAITERKSQLQAQKVKEHIQIVLDFSSLKDVMSKGGLVMSTYKCPNCNGMVNIPEAGKVLMCEYCGTPIKPVDIFEKIKSLLQ